MREKRIKKQYSTLIDPTCPDCAKQLNYIEQGVWECCDQKECGYKESNDLNICLGVKDHCGELLISKTPDFSQMGDICCVDCLRLQGICAECSGEIVEIDNILTCRDCGLVASEDKDSRAIHRMTLIRTKRDLTKVER